MTLRDNGIEFLNVVDDTGQLFNPAHHLLLKPDFQDERRRILFLGACANRDHTTSWLSVRTTFPAIVRPAFAPEPPEKFFHVNRPCRNHRRITQPDKSALIVIDRQRDERG
jgi:hypothetical protein